MATFRLSCVSSARNTSPIPVARARFEREAKSAAALDYPFICKIYEIAELNGRRCIVMEHVAGQTLESRLAEGPLAPAEAIRLAAEVAEALEQAHARRILSLPIWKLGDDYAIDLEWTILRPYENWARHLDQLAEA